MERHYINDLTKEELLDFLQDESLSSMDTDFLKKACIDQLLADSDADNYELIDGILYDKRGEND